MKVGVLVIGVIMGEALRRVIDMRKRAARWHLDIGKAAAEYDIGPSILKALLYKESRFDPAAVGSSGEVGMSQVKEIAASDVGFNIAEIEADPQMQIRAGAAYLARCRSYTGNIWDGLRAYNAGPGGAKKDPFRSADYAADVLMMAGMDYLYGSISGYKNGAV